MSQQLKLSYLLKRKGENNDAVTSASKQSKSSFINDVEIVHASLASKACNCKSETKSGCWRCSEKKCQKTVSGFMAFDFAWLVYEKRFQRRRYFRNQQIRNKNCLWRPCNLVGRIRTKWANFTEDLTKMLPTKLRFTWQKGFKEEEFLKSANQKQESSVAAMFDNWSGRNEQSLQRTFHRCFLPMLGSFGQAVSEEKIVNGSGQNKKTL